MIQTDMFSIATSGLVVQQGLLNTTSNNIANVNTEGYVRQTATSESQSVGGVVLGDVERVVDRFAQEQLIRDTSELGETEIYLEKLTRLDEIFASEAISAAEGMSRYFAALQDATDDPNNMSARQIALSEAEAMTDQFNYLNDYMTDSVEVFNDELDDKITQANSLIAEIADLNNQIKTTQFAPQTSGSEAVKNSRDQAILELSKIVSIDTQSQNDGSTLVFMNTGQSLVLEDGSFNLFSANGNPDPVYRELTLVESDGASVTIPLRDEGIGGEIQGLLTYRDEVLEPNRRELGQVALSLTDAMNEQNKLGMDLDGELGGDIFSTPEFGALVYQDNADTTLGLTARVPDGNGNQITSVDYQITIDAVNVGAGTVDYTVALLNPDGTAVTDSTGAAITQTVVGAVATPGSYVEIPAGAIGADLEIDFTAGTGYTAGDQFLIQPAKEAAGAISVATNRPEDLALAAPVRANSNIDNLGSATVTNITVTNTEVSATPDQSGFDGAGGLQAPGASPAGAGGVGAPTTIVFTAANAYEVRDSAGTVITNVVGATDLQDLLSQASGTAGWTGNYGAALTDYPGYDISVEGVPQAGDTFTIEYNTNGFNDNANGLALSALQDADSTLQSDNGNGTLITFHEAYTGIVGDIGVKTATADVQYQAAVAMERQSTEWVNSVSGVNLDEEAANLIRFQQAYSANARILTTAQSLFQTILGATG